MKERIVRKARHLFFRRGFRDVTMDDVARELGISKKTLYQHFPAKEALIEAAVQHLHQEIEAYLEQLCAAGKDPVEEFIAIREIARQVLKDIEAAPTYQLDRYYPDISDRMKRAHMDLVVRWLSRNIQRGQEAGLYRRDLDADLAARFFFIGMSGIGNPLIFPPDRFERWQIHEQFLRFFLEILLTEEGRAHLSKIQSA